MRLARPNRLLHLLVLCPLLVMAHAAFAQSIRFIEDRKLFVLQAGAVSYVFGINERNELQHVYWGGAVTRAEDFKTPKVKDDWASSRPDPGRRRRRSMRAGVRGSTPSLR